jgi:hypothetical protein
MASFLDMLRQQQAQPQQSFMPDFAPAVNGLLQGYLQGDQMRRQREQDERQRQQDARAEQEFQRKQLEAKIEGGNKQLQALRAGGLNKQAMDFFNQNVRGLMEQQNGYAPPELVGAPQSRAYDLNTHLPMPELGSIPGGNLPDAKTLGFLDNLSGYKPPQMKIDEVDRFKDAYVTDPTTGKPVLLRKGEDKPPTLGSQYKVINGQLVDLTTQQPVYTAPMNPYQQDQSQRGWAGIQQGDRRLDQGDRKLDQADAVLTVRTRQGAETLKKQYRALNQTAATDKMTGAVDQEALKQLNAESDAMIEQSLSDNLKAAGLKAPTELNQRRQQATEAKQKKARDEATKAMARIFGSSHTAVSTQFGQEYNALLDYYYRRAMGEQVGRAPLDSSRIKQMRAASKGGAKPAASPSGVPSPRALMKAIVGNQSATIEIEDD